jgi:hypothetical protein
MKKLSLNVEELSVQSFETQDAPVQRGTVQGRGLTDSPDECETDLVSCGGSCWNTNCGEWTCHIGCTQGATCGNTCGCGTVRITCEFTSPNPEGTCCGQTC